MDRSPDHSQSSHARSRSRPTIVCGKSVEHWIVLVIVLGGLATLIAIGGLTTPATAGHGTHEQLGLPPCSWMVDYGIPCPGCGVTTSISLFAHGRPWAAFVNQPFGFVLALGAAVLPVATFAAHLRGTDLRPILLRLPWIELVIAGATLFTLGWVWKFFELA